ncbi:unnamed protein product [Meloidogyne enterolobii]|uniref:Uncharacterized protein n=2 Tax=Meloidogyne enterolobii TaxID=390850 RepID=A0A6V7WYB1_MELEN|nr:unnamed protein product [Meloidogyne enterolobii]
MRLAIFIFILFVIIFEESLGDEQKQRPPSAYTSLTSLGEKKFERQPSESETNTGYILTNLLKNLKQFLSLNKPSVYNEEKPNDKKRRHKIEKELGKPTSEEN